MPALLIKYWKELAIIIAVAALAYGGYRYIYNIGYEDAQTICAERIQLIEELKDKRIKDIQEYAKANLEQTVLNNVNTAKDIKAILNKKQEPPTVIIEGKCHPSESYVKTFNQIIERANK
jgi:hypothetical protein